MNTVSSVLFSRSRLGDEMRVELDIPEEQNGDEGKTTRITSLS